MTSLKELKQSTHKPKLIDDDNNIKRTLFKVDQKQNKMSANGTPSTVSENSY